MVLKYTPELPLFDERFVNYGYNKIEYTEQLRYYGRRNGVRSCSEELLHPDAGLRRGHGAREVGTEGVCDVGPCLHRCSRMRSTRRTSRRWTSCGTSSDQNWGSPTGRVAPRVDVSRARGCTNRRICNLWLCLFIRIIICMEQPLCIIWDCDGTLLDTEAMSSQIIGDIMESVKPGGRVIERLDIAFGVEFLANITARSLECPQKRGCGR